MIYPTTRRSILVGAAASLICAPAIVRAASLMPVRRVHIAKNPISPKKPIYLGFAGALRLHWMKQALKRGWNNRIDGPTFGGISERQARNYVAYVQSQGTLPPRGARVLDLTLAGGNRIAEMGESRLAATSIKHASNSRVLNRHAKWRDPRPGNLIPTFQPVQAAELAKSEI